MTRSWIAGRQETKGSISLASKVGIQVGTEPGLILQKLTARDRGYNVGQIEDGAELAQGRLSQVGDAAFVDHLAPTMLAVVAKHDLVAWLDLGAGAHDRIGELNPLPCDHVVAFPPPQLKLAVVFQRQRSGLAGHRSAPNFGLRAGVAAGNVGCLRLA
jgi:hypothetical protein